MPMNFNGEFLSTIGIEMESEILNRARVADTLNLLGRHYGGVPPFSVTRDASSENMVEQIRMENASANIPIYTHNKLFQKFFTRNNPVPYGYELVINPTPISELKPLLARITNSLISMGDSTTPRSAVHFHVGFAHNAKLMKKLLQVCLKIDPLLYMLGGMGRTYRGNKNLSAYARPLTNSAAVPLGSELRMTDGERLRSNSENARGFVRIINPQAALEAKTTADFWKNFGVYPSLLGINKYHPARYSGCNFYAILMHGTMEFRHFNQSFDYDLIYTIAKFLRATVEMSTLLKKNDLVEFSTEDGSKPLSYDRAEETLWLIDKYCRIYEVDDLPSKEEYELLMDNITRSTYEPIPQNAVKTHNREFTIPANLVGNLIAVKNPLENCQTDIHNIQISTILGE